MAAGRVGTRMGLFGGGDFLWSTGDGVYMGYALTGLGHVLLRRHRHRLASHRIASHCHGQHWNRVEVEVEDADADAKSKWKQQQTRAG